MLNQIKDFKDFKGITDFGKIIYCKIFKNLQKKKKALKTPKA